MARIDVDKLREHLEDEYGTALMSGFPAALLDLSDVENASGEEFCRMAEEKGVDLTRFEV